MGRQCSRRSPSRTIGAHPPIAPRVAVCGQYAWVALVRRTLHDGKETHVHRCRCARCDSRNRGPIDALPGTERNLTAERARARRPGWQMPVALGTSDDVPDQKATAAAVVRTAIGLARPRVVPPSRGIGSRRDSSEAPDAAFASCSCTCAGQGEEGGCSLELGVAFSSEELGPNEIVRFAARAEEAGFGTGWVSDHFHPWIDAQGSSPFVWSVLGGIAHATETIRSGTSVTCPMVRIHPAVIAQAGATAQCMFDGRFWLGVGSGEALNEHIVGARWPEATVRLAMLEEAIEIIRALWQGDQKSHYGEHFTVENARIYTLPETLPPIVVSAFGEASVAL